MSNNLHRSIISVSAALRPQAGSPAAIVQELTAAFNSFKESHAEDIEKLARTVRGIDEDLDRLNAQMAALKIGGDHGEGVTDRRNASAGMKAMLSFMRTGNPSALIEGMPNAIMSTDSGPDGGYTVPKVIDDTIDRVLAKISPMRALAHVVQVTTSDYHKLISRGGTGSGWVAERQAREETESPILADIAPPIGEIYAEPIITQHLLDDSAFNLADFLGDEVATKFADDEGEAFISGDGINKPRGLLTYEAVAADDATRPFGKLQYVPTGVASGLADETHNGIDALIDLVHSVRAPYRAGAGVGWQMNSKTAAILRKLKAKGESETYLWQPSVIAGQPDMLLGYPVYENEFMSDIGTNAYPIAFGNWRRGYTIVDRIGLRLLRDPYTKKGFVKFYFTKRVGGSVTDTNAIKLLKCAAS